MNPRRGLLVALAIGLLFAIISTSPPLPRGADADPAEFSAGRAMADVRIIAARPHPTGSAENAAVREFLLKRMAALGMETRTDEAPLPPDSLARLNDWSGRKDKAVTLTNLIGILPGRNRALPALMLMSHHDTVWGSPGAADDSTGVAASLEVVRALKARGQPERDVIVLMTDAEELGLDGGEHFFAKDPLRRRVGAIINMEARGGGGRAQMFQTSRGNGAAMQLYASHVRHPATSSLSTYIYSVLPNDTDLTPALAGPYIAYNFAYIGRSGLYHSPLITPDRLDQGSLQDIGGQALDLAAALVAKEAMPGKAPDRVFFDWLGLVTVHYPAWLGWLVLGGAFAGFGWALRRDGMAGLGGGVMRFIALAGLAGALTFAFNWITLGGETGEYYDRLAAIPRLEAIAALACLASFAAVIGPWRTTTGAIAGFAAPLLVLGMAGQAIAPTAIYVVSVPLLLTALTVALPPGRPRLWSAVATAAVVFGYLLSLGHFAMQGVGPDHPLVAAALFAICVLAILQLWEPLGQRAARLTAGIAAGLALALSLWVLLDAPAESAAVYADDKSGSIY